MSTEDAETDRYELALRQKSARSNLLVGLGLLVPAAGFFIATGAAILFAGRLPWALPILGVVLGGIGFRSLIAGVKARSEARDLEAQLRGRGVA